VLAQFRQALAILVVRLLTLESAYVLRIHQDQIELPIATLEYVPHGHPIHARGLKDDTPHLIAA
jgi:hypothetical protein